MNKKFICHFVQINFKYYIKRIRGKIYNRPQSLCKKEFNHNSKYIKI